MSYQEPCIIRESFIRNNRLKEIVNSLLIGISSQGPKGLRYEVTDKVRITRDRFKGRSSISKTDSLIFNSSQFNTLGPRASVQKK